MYRYRNDNDVDYYNADIVDIAQAGIIKAGIAKIFNAEPKLDIQDDHVRIFFDGEELTKAQNTILNLSKKKPGGIRVDFAPVLKPYVIKKYLPIAAGLFALGWLLGK